MFQERSKKVFLYTRRDQPYSTDCFTSYESALEHANSENKFVFTVEVSNSGMRQYLVTSTEDFWAFYVTQKNKNCYELLQVNQRCKLHLDLEFNKPMNCSKEGVTAVKQIIEIIVRKLKTKHGVSIGPEEVMCLDSSDDVKFSVHIIFCTITFASNVHCGVFVKNTMAELNDKEKEVIMVKNGSRLKSMVDVGIYTRNRQFRLYQSSKFGQNRPLVLAPIKGSAEKCESSEIKIFECSLVTKCERSSHHIVTDVPHTHKTSSTETKKAKQQDTDIRNDQVEETIKKMVDPGYISVKKILEDGRIQYKINGNVKCRIKKDFHNSLNQIYFVFDQRKYVLVQHCFSRSCKGLAPVDVAIQLQ